MALTPDGLAFGHALVLIWWISLRVPFLELPDILIEIELMTYILHHHKDPRLWGIMVEFPIMGNAKDLYHQPLAYP